MAYYDWQKIVSNYSDIELKRIYLERYKEPREKVDAVVTELIQRGLLNAENEALLAKKDENLIVDVAKIAGKTISNKKQSVFAIVAIVGVCIIFAVSILLNVFKYLCLYAISNGELITQDIAPGVFLLTDRQIPPGQQARCGVSGG